MASAFLKQIEERNKQYFDVGVDIGAQQLFDMMCLVLNDPEIMGKDTFGAQRLMKLREALAEREAQYHEAWTHTEESDYYQEKLDGSLRKIFGEGTASFYERYPHCKEWDYGRRSRKR